VHTIFVQIAAYRDPELIPTVKDCIAKAKYPDSLHIVIGWQHSEDENIDEIKNLPQVKIIDVPHTKTKGACWIRSKIQQHYDDETYTLQLDSHHRFKQDWDQTCIDMYEGLKAKGIEKPILSSYLPSYQPKTDPEGRLEECWQVNYDRFLPEGVIFFRPSTLRNWQTLTEPAPSRGFSAHFIFTQGRWCLDVPYDPDLYFHGEEISLAIRSWTRGYDLFCPHKVVVWHQYTREGAKKHWDDHNNWPNLNSLSYKRVKILLGVDGEDPDQINFGAYGLGNKRPLHDFELFAGVDFKTRRFHKHSIDELTPPVPFKDEEEFNAGLCNWTKHCIDIYKPDLPENDYDFLVCVFKDQDNKDLFRKDLDVHELNSLMNQDPNDKFIHIWREFETNVRPMKWTIWPHTKSKGWENKILENNIPYA